uniref:ATP-dependent DNA helicase n=1 Tax=Xiphophorus maculatus TaxID=8083 RepID=A0A3B5QQ24_XIPMA
MLQASALEVRISSPPVLLVSATHSQADKRYAAFSRNHQCTCMALTFLAYHNEGLQFDTVMLDRVIEKGDQLYAGVKQQLISDGTFRDNHLTFEQMPDHVLTDRNIYAVHTTGLRVGHVFARSRSTQGSRQLGLHLALQLECLSENVTHAFLLVTPECIAVFRDRSGRFGVFDSHSRNSAGLPHPSGTAVMMTFCNLSDLVSHLLKLFRNRGPNATYEFVPVGFDRENEDHSQNLTFDNISPVATQVSPTALKSESPSDEEMPPWLREVANVLEERPPTITNLSKVPKTDRRKIKNRIKTQQRQNVGSKMKQSSSEKERYLTSPTFRTKKLQALKENYILHKVERKDQLNNRYRTDAFFRKRRINYIKDRFDFVRSFRDSHKAKMAEYMKKRFREDPAFRSRKKSNIRNRFRDDPAFRSRQKAYIRNRFRDDPAFRSRQKAYIRNRFRDDPAFRSRQKSNIRNRFRNDPVFRSKHKKTMREYMKAKYHSEPAYRAKHKEKCAANRRGRLSREAHSQNLTLQHALRITRKYKRNVSFHLETPSSLITEEMKAAIQNFYKNIKNGPTYVCTVCHRALFPNQVKRCKRDKYTKNMRVVADCLTGTYVHVCGSACSTPCSVPEERMGEWICYTCDSHLTRGKMPSIAAVNNLHLASVPPELAELNVLERQLIAKILPFAKIVSLPKGQQRAIHGAVVCVPSEMETVVNSLPRPREEAQLLQVKLKRKTKYKGYQYFYTVNMKNVLAALTKLKESHPDYKEVSINESATFEDFQEDQPVEDLETEAAETEMDIEADQQPDHIGIEHQALRPGLILDTCMQPPDIAQEVLSYGEGIFSIAPAQGNKPISFFSVPRLEANAYPVHFPTGINTLDEARRVALSPSMYFNVRLFSIDTRFAKDQSYLFFAQFVTETHIANSSMSIQRRKGKPSTKDGKNISSKMLQDKEELQKLIQNKEATRFMQPLRGTPAYWEKGLRDLHAMVRQLGKPTFFCTFSAAEMRWPEVIEAIKGQHGEQVDFSELDWNAKCDILRSNPVTVMRMFEKRVDALFRDLILSPAQPLGAVDDYFYRVEFQARGSPHIHAVIWIKDAPEMEDPSCCGEVIKFIDRHISCQLPDETRDPELHKIVTEVQMHSKKHSKSCKKGNVECRFGFPKLAMDRTRITVPVIDFDLEIDDETPKQSKPKGRRKSKKSRSPFVSNLQREAKKKLKTVRDLLKDDKSSFRDLSELLQACNMTKIEYNGHVDALTSGMVVMMKRDPKDSWVNGYNPDLLRAWNANMDIQYVLDEYTCIEYMMSYIAKPEHEMAQFLKSVVDDLKTANVSQRDEMKKIMQAYSKQREVSAQESVARTCSLPLKKSSRSVLFLQTDEDGIKMSLPMSKLVNMSPDEENVWMKGLPEKYLNRPDTLEFEHMCLAEFASEYRVLYGRQIEGPNAIALLNDAGYIQKRTIGKPAVIRFTRFSEKKTPEKFYRRLLKLYFPHRRDEDLKNEECTTYEAFYNNGFRGRYRVKQYVDFNCKRYEGQGKKIDKIMEDLNKQGPVRNAWNTFAPEVEVDSLECAAERPPLQEDEEQDPIPDYEIDVSTVDMPKIEAPKLSPDFIRQMYRSLNETQASVFYAIRDWCLKRVWGEKPEPFFYFLTGGAGCGKSHVIKCVYQEATKLLRQLPRILDIGDMSKPTVLLTAFTGTAAYNISGKTLHSILKLPKSLKPPYKGLGNSLDEVRAVLSNVEILIIDEISMVSKDLLAYVHWRFQQIKGNNRFMGGVSVLAVGDFFQLPPLGRSKPLCVAEDGVLDIWNENFQMISLTEIMRQKDDRTFAELLNRIRVKGKADSLSKDDKTLLIQAVTDSKECPMDVLHIFATNKQVDTHNAAVVTSLGVVTVDIEAEDYKRVTKTGNMINLGCCIAGNKRDLSNNIQAGLGFRVMIIRNLDVEDGLVNGTFGTIADIVTSTKDGKNSVKLIGLKLDNPLAGHTKKIQGKPDSFVYIERFEEQSSVKGVVRRQFPIRLAFGCTAHKVQGMTMKSAVISLKRIFEPGMAYVALSRTTSLEGLKIIDFDESKIYADKNIRAAMESMRSASFLHIRPLLHFQSGHQGATLTIVHHNVEGLVCHSEDMKQHHELMLADVLCLTETHLFGSSVPASCQMEGYSFFSRNRHVSYSNRVDIATKEGGGVATYCRSLLQPQERRFFNQVTDIEFNVVKVETPIRALIATVYRPPSYDLGTFLRNLQNLLDGLNSMDIRPVVILGDFNEDLIPPGKKAINELFRAKGFMQLISDATTEKRTLLDHIYISNPEYCIQSGVLQAYYSYHNPIYCVLASV